MFGYLVAARSNLTEEQFMQYRSAYCGICSCLRKNGLVRGTLCLSYDLVFLWMVLSSMYEPQRSLSEERCPVHPFKGTGMLTDAFSGYAADIGIILAYYKALDDWKDERDPLKLSASKLLQKPFEKASASLPRQSRAVMEAIDRISMLEESGSEDIDALCNAFGAMLGEIFVYDPDDHWAGYLRRFGEAVGRYLYLLDAVLDLQGDIKHGRYNPLSQSEKNTPEWQNSALDLFLGDISEIYGFLPIVEYSPILDSIIYSGMTERYRRSLEDKKTGE